MIVSLIDAVLWEERMRLPYTNILIKLKSILKFFNWSILFVLSLILFLNAPMFKTLSMSHSSLEFKNVAESAGIKWNSERDLTSIAWIDFNQDNFPDLWIAPHAFNKKKREKRPKLYINQKNGIFTDIFSSVFPSNIHGDHHGNSWADFDNDGDLDVYINDGLVSNEEFHPDNNDLWVNQEGIMENLAEELSVNQPSARGRTSLWFDYNLDGLLDLIQLNAQKSPTNSPSTLFKQTVNGFKNVNESVKFEIPSADLAQVTDLYGDGKLDLIVNELIDHDITRPTSVKIYQITQPTFKELTNEFPELKSIRDLAVGDFDGDLVSDLFFVGSNYYDGSFVLNWGSNRTMVRLHQIQGMDSGFELTTTDPVEFNILKPFWPLKNPFPLEKVYIGANGNHPNFPRFSLSVENGLGMVPESDRIPDSLYIGYDSTKKIWQTIWHNPGQVQLDLIVESPTSLGKLIPIGFTPPNISEVSGISPTLLTYDQESGKYVNSTQIDGLQESIPVRSVIADDFDNDMDLDLYLISSLDYSALETILLENQGDGTFIRLPKAAGANITSFGPYDVFDRIGLQGASADYDLDGDIDLFIGSSSLVSDKTYLGTPYYLFQNQGNNYNWLELDLQGTKSSRNPIGTKVFVTTGGKTQLREQSTGQHYYGQNSSRLHFGLKNNSKVDLLRIEWTSGSISEFSDIPVNQILKIVEDKEQYQIIQN